MGILWLGMVASDEMFQNMLARTIGQASAHAAQKSILEGIDDNNIAIDTISAHNYPSYPVHPERNIRRVEWSRKNESVDVSVGFKNIKYYSHISKTAALVKEVSQWLNDKENEEVHIVVYSMHSPFLVAASHAKRKRRNVKVHLIVPDLPQFVDQGANRIKQSLKKLDWLIMKKLMKSVDKYVLFTKQMATFLELKDEDYIVVEGSVPVSSIQERYERPADDNKVRVMYAGAVDRYRGIIDLVEAFKELSGSNYELWITGGGNAAEHVKDEAQKDNRIKYFGYLDERSQVIELERQADILINTRFPDEEVSKYIFPSKIFEYMVTGNPVISVMVPGIPEEYYSYIVGIKSMDKHEIINAINCIADMSVEDRRIMGERGRNFVVSEKNNRVQAKRILDFITDNGEEISFEGLDCK